MMKSVKISAHFDTEPSRSTQCKQKGVVNPVLIAVGGIILIVVVISIASGALKTSFKVTKSDRYSPEQQVAPPTGSQESKSEESESQLKSYSNKNEGLTLQYPGDWSIKENPAAGVIVALGSPQESSSDTFVDNVNLSVSDFSSKPAMTLDQVSGLWQKQTEEDLATETFKLSQIKPDTLAGQDAKRLVFTYSLEGKDIKGVVVITLKDKKAYIVTYTAEKASYDKFEDAANTIISSLQVN